MNLHMRPEEFTLLFGLRKFFAVTGQECVTRYGNTADAINETVARLRHDRLFLDAPLDPGFRFDPTPRDENRKGLTFTLYPFGRTLYGHALDLVSVQGVIPVHGHRQATLNYSLHGSGFIFLADHELKEQGASPASWVQPYEEGVPISIAGRRYHAVVTGGDGPTVFAVLQTGALNLSDDESDILQPPSWVREGWREAKNRIHIPGTAGPAPAV
jgi:hypothetical protein